MIDPKELRIGNWLTCFNRFAFQILDISEFMVCPKDVCPMPLTDAVLEACGFEKDYPIYKVPHESLSHIEKNGDKQTKNYGKWLWFNKYGDMEASVGTSFQYLHQLQNLYFVLTGKELEIDETKLKSAL